MKTIYTIGFTGKKDRAKEFFEDLLCKNNVSMLVDVRLNNTGQLAGFAHKKDLAYICWLKEIEYKHDPYLAPDDLILKRYQAFTTKDKKYYDRKEKRSYDAIDWAGYVEEFNKLMEDRKIEEHIDREYDEAFRNKIICLQCTEPTAEKCHRRLVAERFKKHFEKKYNEEVKIIHL